MKAKNLSQTQAEMLRSLYHPMTHAGAVYRANPFLLASELDGTRARTARALVNAGFAEWRDGVEDNGRTVRALWITDAGRKATEESL